MAILGPGRFWALTFWLNQLYAEAHGYAFVLPAPEGPESFAALAEELTAGGYKCAARCFRLVLVILR